MVSNSQHFLQSDVTDLAWITLFLKHPPGFRKKHPKQRKQKKSRALAPFDRDKKKRRKYRGPKKIGGKRKKS
ncbi:hypothetical protein BGAL_0091g00060 [Botrytis galanthina]|uniref:Uncharacterized protein n=1 Tax=Botrytis galanthina TaxID=278940 RepID=A0A4S8R4K9_9HELO|nr:hypothetical protein BGAL_0091g00060 [Botrytis galanthina]